MDKHTSELLSSVYDDYGPISSFTGYESLFGAPVVKIIVSVGGNPLQVLPQGYRYKVSSSCTEGMLDCPLMNQQITSTTGVQTDSWTQWSSCTKTCDIGTQTRCRYNNAVDNIEYEEQYCNTQCCPGEVGNCVIRKESQTALGYEALKNSDSIYELESCTTNNNSRYELHIISIFGSDEVYEVSIKPRGSVIKPIILVLISFSSVHWRIDTPVGLYKVLVGGFPFGDHKAEKNSSSKCSFEATRRFDIDYSNDCVPQLIKLSNEFGPITSYTGYFDISSETTPQIILEVGGSPLQVLTRDYREIYV